MLNAWDEISKIRKEQIESGADLTFSKVFVPYFTELVKKIKPNSLLEIGCGTGHLSMALAMHVPKVDAIEPSESMYELSCNLLKDKKVNVERCSMQEYKPDAKYNLVISHMCLQAVSKLSDFFLSVEKLLSEQSYFSFSIPHPCFYNNYKKFFKENEYQYVNHLSKTIALSITKEPGRLMYGIPYHHRPLSDYVKGLRDAGMCLLDIDEIFPDEDIQSLYGSIWKEPRYLVLHARIYKTI